MKKFISILVAVMLVASVVVTASAYTIWPCDDPDIVVESKTAAEAIAAYEAEFSKTVDTNRYYFQMPDGQSGMRGAEDNLAPSWYNDYTKGAGVYWWGSAPAACDAWAGYQAAMEDDAQHIFYADVPKAVVAFIWNNGIDGTMDPEYPLYKLACQTVDVACEYPDPGEYNTMPEGADSFDHCIFIVNPDEVSINPLSEKQTCGGTWYFYYVNGCYGMYAEDSSKFKSVEENCCNPDHFDTNGNHVGFVPVVPTEPETDAPVPTEPETEAPVPTEPETGFPVPTEPETEDPVVGIRGDYDMDKSITIVDATRAQNIIAGLFTGADPEYLKAVDADGDGELTIMDATRIQNFLAELMNMDGSKPYVPAN